MAAAGKVAIGRRRAARQLKWRRLGRRFCMAAAGEMAIRKAVDAEAARMTAAGKAAIIYNTY
jgi:hypothetical protein